MAKMSEKEDVETYLELFEKHELFLEIPKELWTAHLRPLLNSRQSKGCSGWSTSCG